MKHLFKKGVAFLLAILCALNLTVVSFAEDLSDSGTCGEGVNWSYDKMSKELSIFGNGAIDDNYTGWDSLMFRVKSIVISQGITSIGNRAFDYFIFLENVSIAQSVNSIGANAFKYCRSLESIEIPYGVTFIGHGAFRGCSSLFEIVIPNSVTDIGIFAFSKCNSVKSVNIPDSVSKIRAGTFKNCSSLKDLTLPYSLEKVAFGSFFGCGGIDTVNYTGSKEQWDKVSIVLHPDATQILLSTFYVYDVVIDTIFMNENEYNLYVVDEGQFQKIVNNSAGEGNFMNLKFTNIYVNDAQESIDAIGKSFNYSFETYNKRLEYECFTVYYLDCNAGNDEKCDEVLNRIGKITNEIECPEDTDDTAAMSEYYDTLYSRVSEYINTLDYVEYTEEAHALAGRPVEEYAYYKAEIDYCYNLYLFFNNRGNPVKPLSTLTSGTCGKGVEWAIDRENGVLSITGNGAIADNYSCFDVFKDIVTTVEIGNGITAIGENIFTGFTAITETKFDGTQAQWDAVAVAEGNDDLLKNVTVNPDPIVEPEEEPTLGDKIVGFFNKISNFFIKVFDWFKNLLGI